MNSKHGKVKGKMKALLLLWLCIFIAAHETSTLRAQTEPTGVARVYGYVRYIESGGRIGYIRRARAELWEDALIDARLAISQTDDYGYYEFNVAMTGSKNVYIKVFCESYIARVTYGIFNTIYVYQTPTKTASEGSTTNFDAYYAPSNSVWWQAMDYATDEFIWIENHVNWVRSQVQIKYPEGSWPISYGDVIELPNITTCPWDRTNVLHEYAHCVMYSLYNNSPPQGFCSDYCQCGDHHKLSSVSDSEFAFSEGWADFMQSAVDNNYHNTKINDLGDVLYGSDYHYWCYTTIESNMYTVTDHTGKIYRFKWYHGRCPYKPPCSGCPSFNNNGNTVEGAVAGIFWDIFDPVNDDPLSSGFSSIWSVLRTYKPRSMVEFLDYWPYTSVKRQLCDVSMDHGITVFDDLDYLFFDSTYFVAGDIAYCTDVLGSAKTSFGLAKGGVNENPEGRTERILKETTRNTGNLILIGGPAVSPLADSFDRTFGITYEYQPGANFRIHYHDKSIYLNVADYPRQDVCIVLLGEDNSRSVMLIWGYGWRGTYAGSAFIGNPSNWNVYRNAHMLMLRWVDTNYDGLVQTGEVWVENSIIVGSSPDSSPDLHPSEVYDEVYDQPFADTNLFGSLASLFYSNTYFVAGNQAYCTDVLGSAKIAFGLAKGGVYENPEGRTDTILTYLEHTRGNLITVGGPAINPIAAEFDNRFGITYNYVPGTSFQIFCEGRSIYLDLTQYPREDVCIIYVGRYSTQYTQNIMLVWGYGWQGTYAGSVFIGNPVNWQAYSSAHLIMLRWRDLNGDGLVQTGELFIEQVR